MRRTSSVALAAAGVISGRTSASGRLYVLPYRRLIRSPGRLRAEGCGWDGRGVVSAVRGALGTAGGQGAAARRHREQQQQLSTWCAGRGGEAAGGIAGCRSAGGQGRRLCRVRDAAAASGGPAAEDIGAPPKHKGLHALSVASRAYLLRRQQGGSPMSRQTRMEVQVFLLAASRSVTRSLWSY